jgi:hypothetical protein
VTQRGITGGRIALPLKKAALSRRQLVGSSLSSRRDSVDLALLTVFLLISMLFIWRAADGVPLALHGGSASQYNALADALLHGRLWIAHFPASLLGPEPLNPALRPPATSTYGDDALYHGFVFLTWGPAPVLVLLVPLHLLGYEPSGSVIIAPFVIGGLGFALAALRVALRQIAEVPLWMGVIAALTLSLASVTPELLRQAEVYQEAIAGGYCFAMAGIWLAVSAVAERRTSLIRLGLMSLCFGLATGSRPTLGLIALLLGPVFLALKETRSRRSLLIALATPIGACFLLLLVYNYARYGDPLEVGANYVLGGPAHVYDGALGYVPIGMWSYLLTPPRISGVFPFISAVAPQLSYPLGVPAHYVPYSEKTSGLLPMTPIAGFLVALPLIWPKRRSMFGSLGPLLLAMASAGVSIVVFLSYELYGTAERYEADYMTLLVFVAVLTWIGLSVHSHGRCRRLIQAGGGLLAIWSCATGIAIGAHGLQTHSGTWRALSNLGSPLSSAIAMLAGHAILAEVYAPVIESETPESYGLGSDVSALSLAASETADLTIVSPGSRNVTLVLDVGAGPALAPDARLEALVRRPGLTDHVYRVPTGGEVRIVVHVATGLNRLSLSPLAVAQNGSGPVPPSGSQSEPLMLVSDPHLASA